MHRTRIKIDGIGHVEDAQEAARAGADAVGMIFHPPAPRNVSMPRATEILADLPPFITPVGVFVDSDLGRIREIAGSLGLRHVQLHGHESPEIIAQLRDFTVIKAVRVYADTLSAELDSWRKAIIRLKLTHLQGIVLETGGAPGGSGVPNDWETIRRHRQRGDFVGLPHLICAGGLTPESVASVVRDIRPWAVDVSSGVESTPGRKSIEKIRAFVGAVVGADE